MTFAAAGVTVLPPGGTEGQRLTEDGIRQFASNYGVSDAELQRFSLKFPPAEVQVDVVVDGYNSAGAWADCGHHAARVNAEAVPLDVDQFHVGSG